MEKGGQYEEKNVEKISVCFRDAVHDLSGLECGFVESVAERRQLESNTGGRRCRESSV
jgi:hypothetical protein